MSAVTKFLVGVAISIGGAAKVITTRSGASGVISAFKMVQKLESDIQAEALAAVKKVNQSGPGSKQIYLCHTAVKENGPRNSGAEFEYPHGGKAFLDKVVATMGGGTARFQIVNNQGNCFWTSDGNFRPLPTTERNNDERNQIGHLVNSGKDYGK
jgi:hypothetical protein